MKEDCSFEVIEITEATRSFFNFLDFAVDPLGDGIGQPMGDEVENKQRVFLKHLGNFDDGL